MTKSTDFWTRSARHSTAKPGDDSEYLHHRIEKLSLVNRALWEIIAKEHGYPKDMLVAKVAEIDLRDGELDKELHEPIINCPECGRKINARHHHCIYCGFDDLPEDVFSTV